MDRKSFWLAGALGILACGGKPQSNGVASAAVTTSAAAAVKSGAPPAAAASVAKLGKGPLPAGFTLVREAAHDGDQLGRSGVQVSLVMSATDDPMLAYLEQGIDGHYKLQFTAWDRDAAQWKGPITIDDVENLFKFAPQLQLARDATSGQLGVVYRRSNSEGRIAFSSDGGKNWKSEKVTTSDSPLSGVALALDQGITYVGLCDAESARVLTRAAASGDFKEEKAPIPSDASGPKASGIALALDADGKPALVYAVTPKDGYNTAIQFWRPGSADGVKVVDSNGIQNDETYLDLAFAGKAPLVVANLTRGGGEKSSTYAVSSSDEKTWTPINIGKDGGQSTEDFLHVAARSRGDDHQAAIVLSVSGGNLDGTKCGTPKLARSNDWKSFDTCSPDRDGTQAFTAPYSAAAFDGKGKLYVALENTSASKQPAGLWVWHD